MSRFRQRDGDLFAPPPFEVEMDDVFIFLLRASQEKLQAVCDNDLNVGPARFEPIGDFVILYGATIDNHCQGTSTRASEIGFWIPVVSQRAGHSQLFTYTPYVWLGNSTSTRVGRTLFGYPKQVADVKVPGPEDELSLEVMGEALAELPQPGTYETRRTCIVSVRQRSPGIWRRPPTHGVLRWLDLLALVGGLVKDLVALPSIDLPDLLQLVRGQRSIFLRQLPGLGEFDPPSYQALIEAAVLPRFDTVSGAKLDAKGWEVTFPSYRQPRIVETLGLSGSPSPDGGCFVAQPIGLAWMAFSGTLAPGREIWRAQG